MKKSKKLISLGVSLAILVTSTGFAFAASNRAYDPGTHKEGIIKVQQKDWGRQSGAGLLSKLVTAGTITAEQQKAVVAAMKPSKGTAVTLENALAGLVTAGTLTQAQADAVAKAYSDAKVKLEAEKEKRQKELTENKGKGIGVNSYKSVLSELVTAGAITVEQQKAVVAAMKPSKGTAVTLENALTGLVTAGTLTQAQADAIAKAYSDAKVKLEAEKEKRQKELAVKKGKGIGVNSYKSVLSELVTAGAITAEQQKAVVAAMKPSKGTAVTLENALAGLVTAGTLTQAQADAVAKAYSDAKAKLEAEKEKCLAELAEKKGITVEELKAQMEKGRIGTVDKSGFRAGTGLKNGRVHAR